MKAKVVIGSKVWRHLLWMVLLGVCLVPQGVRAQAPQEPATTLSQTEPQRPEWQDVGLHDLLMSGGQSALTLPTAHRTPHQPSPGLNAAAAAQQVRTSQFAPPVGHPHPRQARAYLHLLRCLRL